MANRGEINLGQIMRERHGHAAFLIGQFTHSGRVRAAPEWGAPDRVFEVRPALAGSWSDLFHRVGLPAFSLLLRDKSELASAAGRSMSERAIGVVYRPASERQSHYFEASLGRRFDAILFFDRTKPVAALR
jgi:erythromycin esterase-like protein